METITILATYEETLQQQESVLCAIKWKEQEDVFCIKQEGKLENLLGIIVIPKSMY